MMDVFHLKAMCCYWLGVLVRWFLCFLFLFAFPFASFFLDSIHEFHLGCLLSCPRGKSCLLPELSSLCSHDWAMLWFPKLLIQLENTAQIWSLHLSFRFCVVHDVVSVSLSSIFRFRAAHIYSYFSFVLRAVSVSSLRLLSLSLLESLI